MTTSTRNKTAAGVAALLIAAGLSVPLVVKWEGVETKPYTDGGGVRTVCTGHTGGVENRTYTYDECMELLTVDIVEHAVDISDCITVPIESVPPKSMASFISFGYNVGGSQFCSSTLVRKLNAGDTLGACQQLSRWTYDNGRWVRGLFNRREDERVNWCEAGLREAAINSNHP